MNKQQYELLAKLILKYYVSNDFDKLVLSDRPDLQSCDIDFGIEVTRGINSDQGHDADIFDKSHKNEGLSLKEISKLEKHGKVVKKVLNDKSLFHVGYFAGYGDIDVSYKDIDNAIDSKCKKYEEYKKFKNNGIFIFIESPLIDSEDIKKYIYFNHPYINYLFFFIHGDNQKLVVIDCMKREAAVILGEKRYENACDEYAQYKS